MKEINNKAEKIHVFNLQYSQFGQSQMVGETETLH